MFKLAAKIQGGTQKREQVRQLRVRKQFIYTIFTTVKDSVTATHACDGEQCAKQTNGAALLREGRHGDLRKRDNSKVGQKLKCKN